MKSATNKPANRYCIAEFGAWPFISKQVFQIDGEELIWRSRHHRKQLSYRNLDSPASNLKVLTWLWAPQRLNWWIACLFALGSILFALASVISLWSTQFVAWTAQANKIYFIGSIPFTVAAYLQLFQASNAREFPLDAAHQDKRRWLTWRPLDIGWLSSALQFVGTLLFNLNTFDAMLPAINWFQQDLLVWVPNIVGSILFLLSGYLAFIEVCHRYWRWNPNSLSWWIVLINLLGCIGFIISALLAIVLPDSSSDTVINISIGFTLQGAVCFLIGSLLMLPEDAHG